MVFITGFPKVCDCCSIFVIVDQFSKYTTFVPTLDACPLGETTNLFFSNMVKYFGCLKTL